MTDADIELGGKSGQYNSPPVISNWQAQISGLDRFETQEFPMYADARFTSEVRDGCGPYSFLNALPPPDALGRVQVGFYLRCGFHWAYPWRSVNLETDESKYHGGWLHDEVGALASLVLGARIRAGSNSRTFGLLKDDPMGSPRANLSDPPILSRRYRRLIVPSAAGHRPLSELTMLKLLLKLSPVQSVALIRAARLYQDALWVVESEPELAWLMLVSALETGALTWNQKEMTPVEILREAKTEFANQLDKKGKDVLELVADEVAPLFKATTKFLKFSLNFLPKPPTSRPHKNQQISWSKTGWKEILDMVYGYRSRALHSGIPFPRPMCEPPEQWGDESIYSEKGTDALAVRTLGATWNAEAIPISLNTFAQVAREILLAWWRDMADDGGK